MKRKNDTPFANFSFIVEGTFVIFSDESVNGKSLINSWSWDFGDGSTSLKQNPAHTFIGEGTHYVRLAVCDYAGVTDYIIKEITITDSSGSCDIRLQNIDALVESIRYLSEDLRELADDFKMIMRIAINE